MRPRCPHRNHIGEVDALSERALLKFGATLFRAKAAERSSLNALIGERR